MFSTGRGDTAHCFLRALGPRRLKRRYGYDHGYRETHGLASLLDTLRIRGVSRFRFWRRLLRLGARY